MHCFEKVCIGSASMDALVDERSLGIYDPGSICSQMNGRDFG